LHSLHGANPYLFQGLVIESTTIAALHACIITYVYLLMNWLINT
jgi:hypothetical protein